MSGAEFESICERAWAVGCKNGCFNHISPWNEKRWKDGDWEHRMPALPEKTKKQFREVVREILQTQAA